uniref:Uncharacterized protein n=1 Tax=Arundo donax TaxID=35708 RepID=A0A0A9CKY5_ARUDO
MMKGSHLRV